MAFSDEILRCAVVKCNSVELVIRGRASVQIEAVFLGNSGTSEQCLVQTRASRCRGC